MSTSATRQVDIGGMAVHVLADKNDGNWYLQRKTFEEKASPLYDFIRREGFANFIDVGANYGFVSMLARRACPDLNILAVEADARLAALIAVNFHANGLREPQVVNAVAGDRSLPACTFSLNPTSTLDNRVSMAKWAQATVPMITLSELLDRHGAQGRTFIKIDTQGFEQHVLQGARPFLSNNRDWVLKMEFAPDWLTSQGTDPRALLDYLQQHYQFAEFAERIQFGVPNMDALFAYPVQPGQHDVFLEYVTSLNKSGLGWVDLIVRPRP